MGSNCSITYQDVNSNNGFHPNQGFNAGGTPNFPFDNRQQGGMGLNFNISEPSLKDIIREQLG
jgi:hypothetical protein